MFLLERLIGVGIYILLLILVCFLLLSKQAKITKKVFFFYVLSLSMLAFLYVPYENADLYRTYEVVQRFRNYAFNKLLKQNVIGVESGIVNVFYWAIAKTGIPRLLPAITSFVCYSCIFYIIQKIAEKNRVSRKNIAIVLFFYMSTGTYIFVISGIRCMLGISLLSFCFFRESIEGKFSIFHIFLYLIAALIHSYVAVLVAIRFLIPLLNFKRAWIHKIVYACFLGIFVAVIPKYFGNYLSQIVGRAEGYISGDIYSDKWDRIIAIIVLVLVVTVVLESQKQKTLATIQFVDFKNYVLVCASIAVFYHYEFSIFHRTIVYVLPIMSLPLLATVMQKKDEARGRMKKSPVSSLYERPLTYHFVVMTVSGLVLLLSSFRGSFSALKFFAF